MKLLEGKILADKIQAEIRKDIEGIQSSCGRAPKLCTILVGDPSAAKMYAKAQARIAAKVGIDYELISFPEDVTQEELLKKIDALNTDETVTGIILQMPFPDHIEEGPIIARMNPKKDVEGIHADNLGLLVLRKEKMPPCTAQAAVSLIESTGIDLYGAEVTIVGSSRIVGRPIALLLLEKNATTTVTNVATHEKGHLESHVRRADVLVVAVGKPEVIPGEWVKEGAVVIDIGINHVGGQVVGDVEFNVAKERAGFISPVPGGVGPLTVTTLMQNVVAAFKWQNE